MTKYLVIAKEWRDKINGNSYFSAQIESTSNNKIVSKLRFQYGYGNHSLYTAINELVDKGLLSKKMFPSEQPIKYIKIENVLKRDVVSFGQ